VAAWTATAPHLGASSNDQHAEGVTSRGGPPADLAPLPLLPFPRPLPVPRPASPSCCCSRRARSSDACSSRMRRAASSAGASSVMRTCTSFGFSAYKDDRRRYASWSRRRDARATSAACAYLPRHTRISTRISTSIQNRRQISLNQEFGPICACCGGSTYRAVWCSTQGCRC
jgi:hypothetical protein